MSRTRASKSTSVVDEQTAPLNLPEVLYVSGCSLFLSGFIGPYFIAKNDKGEYSWRRPSHLFLGIFDIIPTVITFDETTSNWRLKSGNWDDVFYQVIGKRDEAPIGRWDRITVSVTDPGLLGYSAAVVPVGVAILLLAFLLTLVVKTFLTFYDPFVEFLLSESRPMSTVVLFSLFLLTWWIGCATGALIYRN